MFPFVVYVVTTKNREGKPNGFEKCGGKFYYSQLEANRALLLDYNETSYCVQKCVIMSYDNWEDRTDE